MIYSVVLLAASAAVASAQAWSYNSTTGVFTCPANSPNGAYCAGNDGKSNIIIRCEDGVGHPGNCNDNLSGTFPIGLSYSPCYQTSETAGDAACSKNCIVYGGSGNGNGNFPVPGCVPTTTASAASSTFASTAPSSSSAVVLTSSTYESATSSSSISSSALPSIVSATPVLSSPASTSSSSSSTSAPVVTDNFSYTSASNEPPIPTLTSASGEPPLVTLTSSPLSSTVTSTVVTTSADESTTVTQTYTTTYCPDTTLSSVTVPVPTGGTSASPSNGTQPTPVGPINNGTISILTGSPTATPVGPTSTGIDPPPFTGGAIANSAGAGLAVVGLLVAYFL